MPLIRIFAISPAAFMHSSGIFAIPRNFANFSATNKGLLISGNTLLQTTAWGDDESDELDMRYFLRQEIVKDKGGSWSNCCDMYTAEARAQSLLPGCNASLGWP
jgi:hypothetical protein